MVSAVNDGSRKGAKLAKKTTEAQPSRFEKTQREGRAFPQCGEAAKFDQLGPLGKLGPLGQL